MPQSVCMSCVLLCMLAWAWPASQCACVHACDSASVPSARSQPGQSNHRNRTVQLNGHPCCINEGDGRTWQPKHVEHRAPGRASKAGSAGGKLTPSDKTWHLLWGRGRSSPHLLSGVCMCEYVFHVYVTTFKSACAPACDNIVRLSRSKWRRGTRVKLKAHYKKMVCAH